MVAIANAQTYDAISPKVVSDPINMPLLFFVLSSLASSRSHPRQSYGPIIPRRRSRSSCPSPQAARRSTCACAGQEVTRITKQAVVVDDKPVRRVSSAPRP
jgi:hypothetical protein